MGEHGDTIRDYLAAQPEHALGLYPVRAALVALVAENQWLREALEKIAEHSTDDGSRQLAEAALDYAREEVA